MKLFVRTWVEKSEFLLLKKGYSPQTLVPLLPVLEQAWVDSVYDMSMKLIQFSKMGEVKMGAEAGKLGWESSASCVWV